MMNVVRRMNISACLDTARLLPQCCMIQKRNFDLGGTPRKHGIEHKMEGANLTHWEVAWMGLKMLPKECYKYGQEWREHFRPKVYNVEHGCYLYQWRFQSQEDVDQWIISTDEDMDIGSSSASAVHTTDKCLRFQGNLVTEVPKDGKTEKTGYVNLHSPYNLRAFNRMIPYDWSDFTHVVMRIRGDGRPYMLNIHIETYFDSTWHDMFNFPLYTRGGPYWQLVKVPFSRFLLANKGRIQDKHQHLLPKNKIRSFSMTLMDSAPGQFQLDIDYIGLVYDAYHTDIFYYEMYAGDPYLS